MNGLFAIYGCGFVLISGILVMLHRHAWSLREDLRLKPFPGAPGFVYMLLPVIMPLYGRREARRSPQFGSS